jgi:GNAT superfamily N-acetyltransferase
VEPGERAELRAAQSFYRALAETGEGDALEVGGAVAGVVSSLPGVLMVNRILGLGVSAPATGKQLDEAEAFFARHGTRFSVSVSPAAGGLSELLAARGYEPGYAWMTFRRGVEPYPAETSLRVVDVDEATAGPFAAVITAAYGMPPAAEPPLRAVVDRDGWHCFLTLDGDDPAGAAVVFVDGGAAWFGFAGTAEAHRRKGSQSALMQARVDRARELGATVIATETGERLPDRASSSYRNILRSSFREHALRPNYALP